MPRGPIFGVDARPNSEGVDCADKLVEISEIDLFMSETTNLVGELLAPENDDILA